MVRGFLSKKWSREKREWLAGWSCGPKKIRGKDSRRNVGVGKNEPQERRCSRNHRFPMILSHSRNEKTIDLQLHEYCRDEYGRSARYDQIRASSAIYYRACRRVQARAISFRLDFIFYSSRARQVKRLSTFLLVSRLRVTLLIRNLPFSLFFLFNYLCKNSRV